MRYFTHIYARRLFAVCLIAALGAPVLAQEQTEPDPPQDPLEMLLDEIDQLQVENDALRQELAQARLDAARARRELQELRQFIRDHESLGRDFQQYTAVLTVAERRAREQQLEQIQQRRDAERTERAERRQVARTQKAEREAEFNRVGRYRQSGFSPLGLDIYVSRMAFHYRTNDGLRTRIDYHPSLGRYLRVYPGVEINHSTMTISGSILNAAEVVRNIGIAVTFFDETGIQVGGEIIQINNARPDVPYPFTAEVQMALSRPFSSSSTYVLYADRVEATSD